LGGGGKDGLNLQEAQLDGGWGQLLPLEQWPNYQYLSKNLPTIQHLLIDKVDIIGISNYAAAPADVQPYHIESAIRKLDAELCALHICLSSWRS
jgi:hypothetical protein